MKVLVTGASGGLGARLMLSLAACGEISLRALVHDRPVTLEGVETVAGDLGDPKSLVAATRDVETVVHLAALTHSRTENDYIRVNVEGTVHLIEACSRNGVDRLIFMSSAAARSDGGAYAESKLKAEEFLKGSALSWLILRPREVYGPGMKEGVQQLLRWIQNYRLVPVIGNGAYHLSPVYVDDVVEATTRAVRDRQLAGKILTLAGPESMSFLECVQRLGVLCGARPRPVHLSAWLVRKTAQLLSACGLDVPAPDQVDRLLYEKPANNDVARRLLKFDPRTLEEGLGPLLDEKK